MSSARNNKSFWQTLKSLSLSKLSSHRIINLDEIEKLIDDYKKIAKILNKYFVNILQKSGIGVKKSNKNLQSLI